MAASTYRIDEMHPVVAAFNGQAVGAVPPLATIGPMIRAVTFSDDFRARDPETVERVTAELVSTAQASFEATVGILADGPLVAAPEISAPTLVRGHVREHVRGQAGC